jgi:DNA-binding response OmpR family regulator
VDRSGKAQELDAVPAGQVRHGERPVGVARVLIVEDDRDIAALIKHALEREGGVEASVVGAGDEALRAVGDSAPDLLLLDLNLPVMSGLEVCRVLRGRSATATLPIIMLTAKATESDRVSGLDLGADDYVTKPFSLRELCARVRALLRRRNAPEAANAVVYRGTRLVADLDAVAVSVDGCRIALTRREFELLKFLIQNKDRVVSRQRLLQRVWGYEHSIETRSVDVHIGRLRTKLRSAGAQIETVVGLGYRFVD